ncbi:MAG: DUF6020 family protein [Clostridia bacterium]|nr:DUF6020 family protein [Clostridia bacterium]
MNETANRRWADFLFFLFGILMLASLSVRLAPASGEPVRLTAFTSAWVMVLFAVFALCRAWRTLIKPLCGISLWLLAVVFAGIMTLAESFVVTGTTELLTQSLINKGKAMIYFAGHIPICYVAMRFLQSALTRDVPYPQKRKESAWTAHLLLWISQPKGALAVTLSLLVCWVPYCFFLFPGTVSNDSITQLKEIYGVKALSAGNPLFQTFLLSAFCMLGDAFGNADWSVAAYCCVQAILMAALFSVALRAMVNEGVPCWLCVLSFLFFAFCPIFPVFAFCVGKDTSFAMAVLFFALMVWQMVKAKAKVPARHGVGLCFSAALLVLLRNPGVYLASLALLLLLLCSFDREARSKRVKRWIIPLCALGVAMCTWMVINLAILPLTGAEPMPDTENASIPLQQVARVVASAPETLSEEEKSAIAGVLDLDDVKKAYNGELSDPIKFLWKENASKEQRNAFWRAWLSLARKHPATYFSATFHNSYGYLCPGYVSTVKPTLLVGKQGRTTDLEGRFDFSVNPRADTLQKYLDRLLRQPLFRILVAPGLYGWIVLFTMITLLRGRRKRLLIVALPALFALAGCLISAVNGYFRYAMPLYFCVPLLLALCHASAAPAYISKEESP